MLSKLEIPPILDDGSKPRSKKNKD